VLAARQALSAIVSAATPGELEVAILCRIDGLTQIEAAEVCEISERTVRRLLASLDRRLARLHGGPRRARTPLTTRSTARSSGRPRIPRS
jgi:DNA-directed RNA polymerase specialized sigma24 family protein